VVIVSNLEVSSLTGSPSASLVLVWVAMKHFIKLSRLDLVGEVVVVGVGYREPCIGNQGVDVEWHWMEWDCCCGRRNLGGFFNGGCKCLSRGFC